MWGGYNSLLLIITHPQLAYNSKHESLSPNWARAFKGALILAANYLLQAVKAFLNFIAFGGC